MGMSADDLTLAQNAVKAAARGSSGAWVPPSGSSGGGTATASTTSVWNGPYTATPYRIGYKNAPTRNYDSSGENVLRTLSGMSGKGMGALQSAMYSAGLYGTAKPGAIRWGYADEKTVSAFEDLLSMAARHKDGGGKMSWQEILADLSAAGGVDTGGTGGGSGGGGGGGGYARRSVNRTNRERRTRSQVELTGRDDAEEFLRTAMTDLLGRVPDQKEVNRFMGVLNAEERANPATVTSDVTTTTTGWEDSEGNSSTSDKVSEKVVSKQSNVNPTTTARDATIQRNGAEVAEFGVGSFVGLFEQMLGGG